MTNRTKSAGRGLAALIPQGTGTESSGSDPGPLEVRTVPVKAAPAAGVSDQPVAAAAPDDLENISGLELITLRPDQVMPNPRQPRTEFDPEALSELAASLKEVGFLQPIVVRRAPHPEAGRDFELIAGERRWRASQIAGFDVVPAIIRSTDDDQLLRDALLENLQRVALNPLEEAAAYDQLLADFGGTHDELAQRLGRSRPQVSNTLRLLKLPAPVQRRVAAGILSAGHARALLGASDSAQMEVLAKRVVAEGISVRALEEIVSVSSADGNPARKPRARKGSVNTLPELVAVSDRLSDIFETRVQITMGKSKGRVVIEFADVDDLYRIVTQLGDRPDQTDRP